MKGGIAVRYIDANREADTLTVVQSGDGLRFEAREQKTTGQDVARVDLSRSQLRTLRKQINRAIKGLAPL